MRRSRGGGLQLLAAVAACIPVVGCSVAPSPVATGSASPSIGVSSPAATTAATPSSHPPAIDVHLLDEAIVPADVPSSADGKLLWSASSAVGPAIWSLRPPDGEPVRLFQSEHPDGLIPVITASRAGYAFVELSDEAYGDGGWSIWFLAGPDRTPTEVDHGNAPHAGVAPTIALDGRRLAWASFEEPASGPRSYLEVAELDDLTETTTLLDAKIEDRRLWYPVFSGDELWYATISGDIAGVNDPEYHIEHLDLARPGSEPVRFPGLGLDFNPALSDRSFVFKTNVQGDSALNWGTLHVLDLASGATVEIPIEHANRPSIGDRYIAFDEITHGRLLLFDTSTDKLIDVGAQRADRPPGAVLYGGESVSGRLLAFMEQGTDIGAQPRIGWAILPE